MVGTKRLFMTKKHQLFGLTHLFAILGLSVDVNIGSYHNMTCSLNSEVLKRNLVCLFRTQCKV